MQEIVMKMRYFMNQASQCSQDDNPIIIIYSCGKERQLLLVKQEIFLSYSIRNNANALELCLVKESPLVNDQSQ